MILLRLITWPYFRKHVLADDPDGGWHRLGRRGLRRDEQREHERAARIFENRGSHRRQDRAAGDGRRDRFPRRDAGAGPGGTVGARRRSRDRSGGEHEDPRRRQSPRSRRRPDRRSQPARLRSRERRERGDRRPTGVSRAARFDHCLQAVRREERSCRRQQATARHRRWRKTLHRARDHESDGSGNGVRRQSGGDGYLCGSEDVRPRPHVRSYRPRADRRPHHSRGNQRARETPRVRVPG